MFRSTLATQAGIAEALIENEEFIRDGDHIARGCLIYYDDGRIQVTEDFENVDELSALLHALVENDFLVSGYLFFVDYQIIGWKPDASGNLIKGEVQVKGTGPIQVYIDGACPANGKTQAKKAGCGIHYPSMPDRDAAFLVPTDKPTNNIAELTSLYIALDSNSGDLDIHSDSKYCCDGFGDWMHKWVKNDWKTAGGSVVVHLELWRKIYQLSSGRTVRMIHVAGHAGIAGNERADKLANDAINDNCTHRLVDGKLVEI